MKTEIINLNLAHLLFLHGLTHALYQETKDNSKSEREMSNFLHDLIILFELYIDACEKHPELLDKFNYKPLKPQKNENEKLPQ